MSLSFSKSNYIVKSSDDSCDSIKLNQLYQSNSNNGIIADILHRGILSGDFRLSDADIRSTILALSKNIVLINDDIHELNTRSYKCAYNTIPQPLSCLPGNAAISGVQDCNSDSSSLTNSVHIQDVTDDTNDKAQEPSSYRQVSRIGENVDELDIIGSRTFKKRVLVNSTDTDKQSDDIRKKKKTTLCDATISSLPSSLDEILSHFAFRNIDISTIFQKYDGCGK
jgi:hypothetical protein